MFPFFIKGINMKLKLFCIILVFVVVLTNFKSRASDEYIAAISVGRVFYESPYKYLTGASRFYNKSGINTIMFTCRDEQSKQVVDIKKIIERTGKNVIFFVDSYSVSETAKIAKLMEEEGIYWMSWLAKAKNVSVTDYKYWVSHTSFDFEGDSEKVSEELANAMGGKGNIVAIAGPRLMKIHNGKIDGLIKVIQDYPGLNLVKTIASDGSIDTSYELIENILESNPDITGVWTALDNIALGVIECIKAKGLEGKIKVVSVGGNLELFEAIKNNKITAAVYYDNTDDIVEGLLLVNDIKNGNKKIGQLSNAERELETTSLIVNSKNVDDVINDYITNEISNN